MSLSYLKNNFLVTSNTEPTSVVATSNTLVILLFMNTAHRWVHMFKTINDSIVPKARLVARGFEEYDQNIQKDSPHLCTRVT